MILKATLVFIQMWIYTDDSFILAVNLSRVLRLSFFFFFPPRDLVNVKRRFGTPLKHFWSSEFPFNSRRRNEFTEHLMQSQLDVSFHRSRSQSEKNIWQHSRAPKWKALKVQALTCLHYRTELAVPLLSTNLIKRPKPTMWQFWLLYPVSRFIPTDDACIL